MNTIYISGPITGLPDGNRKSFMDAQFDLESAGFRVINPITICSMLPEGTDWATYMRHDIRAMMDADAVLLLPGWQSSRGAGLEEMICVALGIPTFQNVEDLLK